MLLMFLGLATALAADVHVTHSGRALDANGEPINAIVNVQVRLLDSDVNGADTQLWADTFANTPVSDGYFSVVLGSDDPLPASVFRDNPSVWVESTIGTSVLARQELGDVPTAATARAITLPEPSAACADGALAYDAVSGEVQVCAAGGWTGLASDAQIECTARGGEWTGSGCIEFAVKGCDSCTSWNQFISVCTAMDGYHPCTWAEYPVTVRSLQGQVQDDVITIDSSYLWVAGYDPVGSPNGTGNQLWYPWSSSAGTVSNRMACGSDSAIMMGLFQLDANDSGANGCYVKTYTNAVGACCRDFPW